MRLIIGMRRMRPRRGCVGVLSVAALAGGCAAPLGADPVNILPLGDSLTFGVGDPNNRGYSYYLQDYLVSAGFTPGTDFDFIGGRASGTGALPINSGVNFDPDRWGVGGAIAANTPNSNNFIGGGGTNNLVNYLQNYTTNDPTVVGDFDGVFTGTNAAGTGREVKQADIVLLHIGTNPLVGDSPSNPRFGTVGTVAEATGQFGNLLTELRARWDAGNIAPDAKVFFARIIVKPDDSDGGNDAGNDANDDDTVRNTNLYNNNIVSLVNNLPTNNANDIAFKAMFSVVDMFNIQASQDLLDTTGLSAATVNPEAGDSTVDFVLGLNESNPQAFNDSTVSINTALMQSDYIHLTQDGFKVMAYQWLQALLASGKIHSPVPGDLNGDHVVNDQDLAIVLGNFGSGVSPGDLLAGDATADGLVNMADLNFLLRNWPAGSPPPSLAVPEPGTFTLVAGMLGLLLPRRRRRD